MIPIPLQDYIFVQSDSAVSAVTQNETGWLDLAGFQDVVAFLEVKEFSGASSMQILYQTSPTKDEVLFANMTSAVTLAAGLTVTKILKPTATVPVARWVRWRLSVTTAGTVWGVMFRVWLACNRAGKRGQIPLAVATRSRMLIETPSVSMAPAVSVSSTNWLGGTGGTSRSNPPGGFIPGSHGP